MTSENNLMPVERQRDKGVMRSEANSMPALTHQSKIDTLINLLVGKYDLSLTPTLEAQLQQDLQWLLQGDSLLAGVARHVDV